LWPLRRWPGTALTLRLGELLHLRLDGLDALHLAL
jgi:hypothetical protein